MARQGFGGGEPMGDADGEGPPWEEWVPQLSRALVNQCAYRHEGGGVSESEAAQWAAQVIGARS